MLYTEFMEVMLTGFTAFLDNKVNPTELIAEHFSPSIILPVEYEKAWEKIEYLSPYVFIHMGLAQSRNVITIEKYAYNQKNSKAADNSGRIYLGEKIAPSAPERLQTPFDTEKIVEAMKEGGINASESIDPGRYVCNALYYLSLLSGSKSIFIHFPPLEKMSLDKDIKAVEIIRKHIEAECSIS